MNFFTKTGAAILILSSICVPAMADEYNTKVKLKLFTGVDSYKDAYSLDATFGVARTASSSEGSTPTVVTDIEVIGESRNTKNSESLLAFGVGLEYEMTSTFGVELRHYFGASRKVYEDEMFIYDNGETGNTGNEYFNFNQEASLESATALLLNVQTPAFYGLSGYAQVGPSIVTNSIGGYDVSKTGLSYGLGAEYSVNKDISVFLDALIMGENYFKLTEQDFDLQTNFSSISGDTVVVSGDAIVKGTTKNTMLSVGIMMKF